MNLYVDPEGQFICENTGALDRFLCVNRPQAEMLEQRAEEREISRAALRMSQKALSEGRSVFIYGDTLDKGVFISLNEYKRLDAAAEHAQWRTVGDDPPPNIDILVKPFNHILGSFQKPEIWNPERSERLYPKDMWRPLD